MTRSITTLALALSIAVAALAADSLDPGSSSAKGNVYVLTGGELGDYAYTWIGVDIPGDDARAVPPPAELPALKYELFSSWGNLAVPYQIANGGADLEYYPDARLLVSRNAADDPRVDYWHELSPDAAASLDTLIDGAIAAKSNGTLVRGAIEADLRARRMAEVNYSFAPYAGSEAPPLQIGGDASERFVMSALAGTVDNPAQPAASARPAYRISYEGTFAGGGGIGGLLGFYAPPRDDAPGIFWDEAYPDPVGQAYQTTSEFDAMVEDARGASPTETAAAVESASSSSAALLATAMGSALAASLGGAGWYLRRAATRRATSAR